MEPQMERLSPMEPQMERLVSTTPSLRQDYDIALLSKKDKQRVLAADPNKGHCMITNALSPLNFCHCVPRSFMKDEKIVSVYRIHRYLF